MNLSKYIGLSYKHLGRDNSGIDCYGVVYLIYKQEFNIILSDYTELRYTKDWYKQHNHIVDNFDREWQKIELNQRRNFDVLVLSLLASNHPHHCGLVVEEGAKMLHIMEGSTSHLVRLTEPWLRRVKYTLRYRGEIAWQK